ncbi:MAG: ribonuclease HI [Clostridiales Family XIII bacterium]|jgi:ribonuclease HI|nr:ribonuclease HI [Clostridiales Family XIII bacterium]
MTKTINIYTDGACAGNQFDENTGGWGAILEYGGYVKELFGGEADTTNNRMELLALIAGLSALTKTGYPVRVFSDSSYVMKCLRERWHERWRENGWKTQARKPVENRDLWERLVAFLPDYDFRFYLVKGHVRPDAPASSMEKHFAKFREHNGDGFSMDEFRHIIGRNNEADALANRGIEEVRARLSAGGPTA